MGSDWQMRAFGDKSSLRAQTKSSKTGNVELESDDKGSGALVTSVCLLWTGTMVSCVSWEHMCASGDYSAYGRVYVSL